MCAVDDGGEPGVREAGKAITEGLHTPTLDGGLYGKVPIAPFERSGKPTPGGK